MYEFHYYELQVPSDTILNFLQWQFLKFVIADEILYLRFIYMLMIYQHTKLHLRMSVMVSILYLCDILVCYINGADAETNPRCRFRY